ncbi:uncharacterized protein L969DRAFT_18954 [Mixia osmundae IAM 14324]|uniref:PCI domain-containing protein n=1 Tax=Mixia osmundae (strain CBS 9802 / IAM 14324 / JCM 22182 / KY 12970) TaxID=764103 RepID=G7DWR9_MIXOS|nr:uncharacterized protein L969DRAFT_80631 [Mixia osmundae IAM 14324]XP_014566412.1 uncharacterized protein L969DRAFT_18954 [Mixia osmundae IAM 14324]KEI36206.1 hypothetical protein L969DRAFT_80631 [Mixia osmundae IAM 14324]KEI38174.1 hypothetical protein L969DRAFT_18954 [Mixia osmundae IAM 14324]GAA95016.1 hypothetical protein E5Q_01671 [Mixia osmundae IAM 14324]
MEHEVRRFGLRVKLAYESGDARALAACFEPLWFLSAQNDSPTRQLALALQATNSVMLSIRSLFKENGPLGDLVHDYLRYLDDARPGSPDLSAKAAAYELIQTCYTDVLSIFQQPDSDWLVPTLKLFSRALALLALQADEAAHDSKNVRASLASRLLIRTLNVISTDKGATQKRLATFYVANQCLRIYFKLDNLRLTDTIINNTRHARPFLDVDFPKSDRVTYRYYIGRIYLSQRRLRQARQELQAAFDLCSPAAYAQCRMLLIFLIAASLPLGILPSKLLLQQYDLEPQYGPLTDALKLGDYTACVQALDRWREWHRSKGAYVLLKEKLEVICWRNLCRKVLWILSKGRPTSEGPPTLPLDKLLAAAQYAWRDPTLDLDDMHCVAASLNEQGYSKAYIHQARNLLVLQKGPQAGFPPVSSVRLAGAERLAVAD